MQETFHLSRSSASNNSVPNNRKAFIIGNGFDLDLGWPTSYSCFYKYEFGPISDVVSEQQSVLSSIINNKDGKESLLYHVLKKYNDEDKWMSLENVLMSYYQVKTAIIQGKIRDDFTGDEPIQTMFDIMLGIASINGIQNVIAENVDENDKLYFHTLKQDLKTYLEYATNVPCNLSSTASCVFEWYMQ